MGDVGRMLWSFTLVFWATAKQRYLPDQTITQNPWTTREPCSSSIGTPVSEESSHGSSGVGENEMISNRSIIQWICTLIACAVIDALRAKVRRK